MSVKLVNKLIPKTNIYTRPRLKMKPTSITIHETGNRRRGANALAHARLQQSGNSRQASWHIQVDDGKVAYVSIPFDEVAWAAGDGRYGPGNNSSIHLEICVNEDGNFAKGVHHAAQVVRYLMKKFPHITLDHVMQHYHWNQKNCPRFLRSGERGIDWLDFIEEVRRGKKIATYEDEQKFVSKYQNEFKKGDRVRI